MKLIDAHLHAREAGTAEFNEVMPIYSALSAGVYMMNFAKPLDISGSASVDFIFEYRWEITQAVKNAGNPKHRALLMPVMADIWTPRDLRFFIDECRASKLPIAGFKLFAPGQSTNAGYAPTTEKAAQLIDVLEEKNMPLALHMEDPEEMDFSEKESSAVENILPKLVLRNGTRRKMPISMEHISTAAGRRAVRALNLNFTITPHHLGLDQEKLGIKNPKDAEAELKKNPHLFCKPVINRLADHEALALEFSKMGDNCMLGSDSAPHDSAKKLGDSPAAGIFMGGTMMAYLAAGADVETIGKYSANAADFYRLEMSDLPDAVAPDESALRKVFNARDMMVAVRKAHR